MFSVQLLLLSSLLIHYTTSFVVIYQPDPLFSTSGTKYVGRRRRNINSKLNDKSHQIRGDPLRDSTGIRPSLHPLTINVIAEALKLRAQGKLIPDDEESSPLQIALAAGKLAATAIQKRQDSSDIDGMKLTVKEQQTVAGRVVGVVIRIPDLEQSLREKCNTVKWIAKYDEWNTFGILGETETENDLVDRLSTDPLFGLNRAESLLAIFLHTIEKPELQRKNESVPDNSTIDFLDTDRMDVLMK